MLKGRSEALATALVITLVLMGLIALLPAVAHRLSERPAGLPSPTARPSAPPAAVLLPDELEKALEGVMTIANDQTYGTAFMVDARGDFLTAASVVQGSVGLRLIDNTGGMHQVSLLGIDTDLGVAMFRASVDGAAMTLGEANTVSTGDPVVVLASPKVQNLNPSTAATLVARSPTTWRLQLDDVPANVGGPVVGPGARVVALLLKPAMALPIDPIEADVAKWQPLPGTPMPLAPYPAALLLRGSDTTSTPGSGASLLYASPSRASRAQETVLTIHGTGFVQGPALAVHFAPLSGSSGAFDGSSPTVTGGSTITVKVPLGELVQDYAIELINGNGVRVSSLVVFTVVP